MHSAIPIMQRSRSKNGDVTMKKVDATNVLKSPSSSSRKRLDASWNKLSAHNSPTKNSKDKKAMDNKKTASPSRSKSRGRSKSRTRSQKQTRELTIEEHAEQLPTQAYDSWDFGKVKTFARPKPDSRRNNRAATTINRMMRGWWARLHFQMSMLQFKLEHKDLLTQRALIKVKEKTKAKKDKIRRKFLEKHEKGLAKATKEQRATQEAQKLIQKLRDENKKLREKNQKIFEAAKNLKQQNDRLENTTTVAEGNIDVLSKHAKQIKETHDKLVVVEPKYKDSVEQLLEGVEVRRQYCATERSMKLMYVKCVGGIVDLAEDKLRDKNLLDEIVGYVLDTEDMDHEEPLPEKVVVSDPDEDSDDDSIDEYSVHSYGS